MKIALCQINPTVGAINQNKKSIFDWYHRAIDLGADLVVFPELSLIGYPPQDLLLRNRFIEKVKVGPNMARVDHVATEWSGLNHQFYNFEIRYA